MKIVYLPLDERPCNYNYPIQMPIDNNIEIALPDFKILSLKKKVCDVNNIINWLKKESVNADYAVISLDMLLFGGIIPSRLHRLSLEEVISRVNVLLEIKKNNPHIKIYANELIMRCPSYSSSVEEPDYFDECGFEIFKYGELLCKEKFAFIDDEEIKELERLKTIIKKEYLDDFMTRREINLKALLNNFLLVKNNIVDFFVVPQDDCSPFGFSSMDQKNVRSFIKENHLESKILMYPGADEIGLTLLARAINDFKKVMPKVYVYYSSSLGKYAIPSFEDRPIDETIKYHLIASKSLRVYSFNEADIVLGINLGSEFLTKNDPKRDFVYNKNRNLNELIEVSKYSLNNNKVFGIADVAFCNEGDDDLLEILKQNDLLYQIDGYAGWNTSSNTLGTVICSLVSFYHFKNIKKKDFCLTNRYIDDYIYMAIVRKELEEYINSLNINGIDKFNLGQKQEEIEQLANKLLLEEINKFSNEIASKVSSIHSEFIWNRIFENKITIKEN